MQICTKSYSNSSRLEASGRLESPHCPTVSLPRLICLHAAKLAYQLLGLTFPGLDFMQVTPILGLLWANMRKHLPSSGPSDFTKRKMPRSEVQVHKDEIEMLCIVCLGNTSTIFKKIAILIPQLHHPEAAIRGTWNMCKALFTGYIRYHAPVGARGGQSCSWGVFSIHGRNFDSDNTPGGQMNSIGSGSNVELWLGHVGGSSAPICKPPASLCSTDFGLVFCQGWSSKTFSIPSLSAGRRESLGVQPSSSSSSSISSLPSPSSSVYSSSLRLFPPPPPNSDLPHRRYICALRFIPGTKS